MVAVRLKIEIHPLEIDSLSLRLFSLLIPGISTQIGISRKVKISNTELVLKLVQLVHSTYTNTPIVPNSSGLNGWMVLHVLIIDNPEYENTTQDTHSKADRQSYRKRACFTVWLMYLLEVDYINIIFLNCVNFLVARRLQCLMYCCLWPRS